MVEAICNECFCQPQPIGLEKNRGTETITTGDDGLDLALGGGVRTGMIWEVVGERLACLCHVTESAQRWD
jgi:DNA repair protein RAD57